MSSPPTVIFRQVLDASGQHFHPHRCRLEGEHLVVNAQAGRARRRFRVGWRLPWAPLHHLGRIVAADGKTFVLSPPAMAPVALRMGETS